MRLEVPVHHPDVPDERAPARGPEPALLAGVPPGAHVDGGQVVDQGVLAGGAVVALGAPVGAGGAAAVLEGDLHDQGVEVDLGGGLLLGPLRFFLILVLLDHQDAVVGTQVGVHRHLVRGERGQRLEQLRLWKIIKRWAREQNTALFKFGGHLG